jgi:hypothetical protein
LVVDTPTATAAVAPFAAAQAPTVAVGTELSPVAATTNVAFVDNQLGPTYVEIKTTSTGTEPTADCVASQPIAIINSAYEYSYSAFPAET